MSGCRSHPVLWGCLFFLLSFPSQAQDLEVGVSGGGAYYLGDLNPGTPFLNSQLSFGGLVRYNINTRLAVKLGVMRGSLKGDESHGTPNIRNLDISFSTKVTDFSAVAEFNFFPYFTGSERDRITPYIYAGISGFYYSVNAIQNKVSTKANNIGFSIPFGLGAKVSLASRLGMQIFWEMHKTFTDEIDLVTGNEYPVSKEIMGDPNTKDWFSFFGVSLSYKFNLPGSKRCKDLNH